MSGIFRILYDLWASLPSLDVVGLEQVDWVETTAGVQRRVDLASYWAERMTRFPLFHGLFEGRVAEPLRLVTFDEYLRGTSEQEGWEVDEDMRRAFEDWKAGPRLEGGRKEDGLPS